MANWGNLQHHISLRTRKTKLYYMVLTTVLCSSFYLIGTWQHGGNIKITNSLDSSIPCNPTNHNSQPGAGVPLDQDRLIYNNNGSHVLDFAAHHTAEDLVPLAPVARVSQFPPCSIDLSEYTPCEDAKRSLPFPREMLVYRERHCPAKEEVMKCRVPAPFGYRAAFRWPESRDNVWYANVPHKHLTVEKAGQNWVRFEEDRFTFPGGGTMFPHGAEAYIDDIAKLINLGDGSIRTAIDTGCGVASFGAYLLSRDILPMSFAPKDTHEAQVQFALERGIPAIIGIMASTRLPYPARAFDMAHCSRCLIPWAKNDGLYLIEVDRILRPGGYWVLSGPPINWENRWIGWNRTREDLKAEQDLIEEMAKSLCWKKIAEGEGIAVWQKPSNHIDCKLNRVAFKKPPICENQDPDTAWYTKMEACLTPLPEASGSKEYAGGKLANWPERLTSVPPRIASGKMDGITEDLFQKDKEVWKKRIPYYKKIDSHLAESGRYRNLLDMNAYLGGFAAALIDDPVWVMNIVPVEAIVNTLGVIYERGLIGTYQNWCEAMSTYPRTYDFIHSDSVFSLYQDRCEMEDILLEMDRILRPQGSVIFRDDVDILVNVKSIVDGLQWESRLVDHENGPHVREKILIATKQYWTAPAASKQGEDGSVTTTS